MAKQEQVLSDILQLCDEKNTLILHIRGQQDDFLGNDVYANSLEIVKKHCVASQPIHLHCFTGGDTLFHRW